MDIQNYEDKVEYSKVLADFMDFLNEKTSLMYLREKLGEEVERSSKSHSELAGEGIEHSWGRAKCVLWKSAACPKAGKRKLLQAFT
jgi:hypothetical protein